MSWLRQRPPAGEEPAPPVQTGRPAIEKTTRERRLENLPNIGRSVEIKGELTGSEDLTIDGTVDGTIVLNGHSLTVGANGKITAEIRARTVTVVGQVIGNITADERVEVTETGSLIGDILAPRVVLGDGARFRGGIDMEREPGTDAPGIGAPAPDDATFGTRPVSGSSP